MGTLLFPSILLLTSVTQELLNTVSIVLSRLFRVETVWKLDLQYQVISFRDALGCVALVVNTGIAYHYVCIFLYIYIYIYIYMFYRIFFYPFACCQMSSTQRQSEMNRLSLEELGNHSTQ